MFTPQQRKGFSGWSISPRDPQRTTAGIGSANTRNVKGKGVAASVEAGPTLPWASLGENGRARFDGDGDLEVWQQFREAGLLDEAALEKKDREDLVNRISKLEHELHEYQYTMGLLLIEKKEWTSKHEDLRQTLAEAEEILKREQAAHLIAMSEVEKREENLRKAVGVDKHRIADLEKSLHEVHAKSSDVKVASDKKLAEAHAVVVDVEEKSLEVERKLHAADAKLAEASRKHSEMVWKLQELETRESLLHKERMSIKAEHEEQEGAFVKQREDLRDWERRLWDGQERLIEGQRLLNQRENRANDKDMVLNKKEKDLEDARKTIEITSLNLQKVEADISARLTALAVKEEEAAVQKQDLEVKEQELLALEQKLKERETMETWKLTDQHNAVLDMKKRSFELELDERRKSIDKELKGKLDAVEQKKDEINRKEEKVVKREQSLEKKLEKLKDKEKDYELKFKSLKEREKLVKAEEKGLEAEKREVDAEKQDLLKLKAELGKERDLLIEEKQQILREQDNLKVTDEERGEVLSLRLKLKLEVDNYNHEKESLMKERENLKQERVNFERDWETLDDKRVDIAKELSQINKEKERLEKWKQEEEKRLRSEKAETEEHIQKELEALRLKKEAFEGSMQHERSEIFEKARKDHDDMLHSFDLRSHDLETAMQTRREDMEKLLQEKQRAFEEETERELAHINFLREQAQRGMEEIKLERQRLERERQEIADGREHVERDQLEIRNDIDELNLLSSNLSRQREVFMKERSRFLACVGEHKSCRNCGALVSPDLETLPEIEDAGPAFLPRSMKEALGASEKPNAEMTPAGKAPNSAGSGGRMSWLRKCTSRIFSLSPGKKNEDATQNQADGPLLFPMEASEGLHEAEDVPGSSVGAVSDSFDIERIQSDNSIRETENEQTLSIDEQSEVAKIYGASEAVFASLEIVEDSQPLASKHNSRRRPGKRAGRRGTLSLKKVVEEAKAFLGEALEPKMDDQLNEKAVEPSQMNESGGDSRSVDGRSRRVGRKRRHAPAARSTASEQDADDSEARSDSATTGGRRKRQQTVAPGTQTPGERRYYFRRSTVAGMASTTQALADRTAETVREDHPKPTDLPENKALKVGRNAGEADPILEPADASPVGVASGNDKGACILQKAATKNVNVPIILLP
ncbi:nuclear matrix constituent protein 1-like isoform X2 [Magnolia sinica]|uniref:nuclear matrix constituent protein 1-like isoform X2 n=1 Tax=Magnolia sinica TaxID=86752 RepID=UPI0026586B55|nr:nuclear matrix constituent protein 1-like isoform X2 [Magnolia sinica]